MTTRNKRPDEAYEIESQSKGWAILEALEGSNFEPATVQKLMERTGFTRDLIERSLKTMRLRGYAAQDEKGRWVIGKRLVRFAEAIVRNKR
jgi:DNA-binding IclR family transcriptional regulator